MIQTCVSVDELIGASAVFAAGALPDGYRRAHERESLQGLRLECRFRSFALTRG